MKWVVDLLTWFLCSLAGPFVYLFSKKDMSQKVPLFGKTRGFGKFANMWINHIWGNKMDGLTGDKPYRENEAKKWFRKLWPSFWWSCVRNPANNYTRSIASGKLVGVQHGKIMHKAKFQSGQSIWFFYTPQWPVMFKFGYKIWEDAEVGKYYTAKLAFSIQRGNKV